MERCNRLSRAIDKSRAARWCKVCDEYRQTYQVEKAQDVQPDDCIPQDGSTIWLERCLFCDSVCSKNKKPRKKI